MAVAGQLLSVSVDERLEGEVQAVRNWQLEK
jgi:hypothetical protein